jgi:hypothetical protein
VKLRVTCILLAARLQLPCVTCTACTIMAAAAQLSSHCRLRQDAVAAIECKTLEFQLTIHSLAAVWLEYGTIRLPWCFLCLTDTAATVVPSCSRTTDLLVPHKDCPCVCCWHSTVSIVRLVFVVTPHCSRR